MRLPPPTHTHTQATTRGKNEEGKIGSICAQLKQ